MRTNREWIRLPLSCSATSESEREGSGRRVSQHKGGSEMVLTFTLFTWPALLILPQFGVQGRYFSGFVASIVWFRSRCLRQAQPRCRLFLGDGARNFFLFFFSCSDTLTCFAVLTWDYSIREITMFFLVKWFVSFRFDDSVTCEIW